MSEELKPCPFCGGNATSYGTRKMESGGLTHCLIHCDECSARLSAETENDAVEAWNRRTERTCRYVRDHTGVAGNWFCKCSECGAEFDERMVDRHFVYCPECGARVVSK